MQQLDDDMDELFRNAASRYPLKTDGADWDALSRRLHPENDAVPPPPTDTPVTPRTWRWWRALGLLTLLLTVGIYWVTREMDPGKNTPTAVTGTHNSNNAANSPVAATASTPGLHHQTNGVAAAQGNTVANGNANTKSVATGNGTNTDGTTKNGTAGNDVGTNAATKNAQPGVVNATTRNAVTRTNAAASDVARNNVNAHTKNTTTVNNTATTGAVISGNTRSSGKAGKQAAQQDLQPVRNSRKSWMIGLHSATMANSPDNWSIGQAPVVTPSANGAPVAAVTTNTDSSATSNVPTELNALNGRTAALQPAGTKLTAATDSLPVHAFKGAGAKTPTGFYAGIVIAPDLSTVKMQQTEALGYSLGAVIGYRISEHWAVETGAAWEKKNYYSKGQYFDKSKLKNPDVNIINLNGYCKMVDVPINVRYYFNIKQKHSWYANAGLSSYFMSREWYRYDMENNGAYYDKAVGYNTATQNWFSVLNLGVGFEQKLGSIGNLRVEPYVKVPVAGGIGIGSLPVTSVGINIGITRNFRW